MPTGVANLLWVTVDANCPATSTGEQLGLNPCATADVNHHPSREAEMGYRILEFVDFYGAV